MTPFSSAGDLLSQYQLSDEERKNLLLGNLLLGLGGGLMTNRGRGNMFGAAGSGAVQGAMLGQNAIADARKGKLDEFKMRLGAQEYDQKNAAAQAAAAQQAEAEKALGGIFGGAPQLDKMGPGGPTPQNAAAVAPPSQLEQYRKAAAFFAAKGDAAKAKTYSEIADKMEEEFATTPHVGMSGGQAVNALISKRGTVKELPQLAPTPDFMTIPLGGTTQVVNRYGLPSTGATFAHTFTPEGKDASARGWAGLDLERQKFGYQQQRDAAGANDPIKPQPLHADERKQLQEFQSNKENISMLRNSFKDQYAGRGAMGQFDVSAANTLGSSASKDAQDLAAWWNDYEKMVNLPERFAVFGASLTQGEKQSWDAARRVRPGADPKQVRDALKTMEDIADRKMGGLRESLIADKRQPAAIDAIVNRNAAQAGAPAPGAIVGGYRFNGGDPNKRENWTKV